MSELSTYTPELAEEICARIAEGEPLRAICRSSDRFPTARTVGNWRKAHPEFDAQFKVARELGEEALAEECLEIADDSRNDWMDRAADGGDERALEFNGEHVQRSKLRIETRLKLLAKFNPSRWGEKVTQEISGPGGQPVQTVTRIELVAASGAAGDDGNSPD